MRQPRPTARGEHGFTLAELLVVILIIGVLIAIAIPAFLNQTTKATDASAEELARSAATAAETWGTDHQAHFNGITAAVIHATEATIPLADTGNNAYLADAHSPAAAGTSTGTNTASGSYSVTVKATDGNTFTIARNDDGVLTRTCNAAANPRNGSCIDGSW
jgi:type IV pilus assembly protein PilA